MSEIFCPQCRHRQQASHAYCARCGLELPKGVTAERKRARFFAGLKVSDQDPKGAFLRVSCYHDEQLLETDDGSVRVPVNHVRFSMWVSDEARCVLSIPETEARDLVEFITHEFGLAETQGLDAPPAR